MITITIPENAVYDELVVRTIANITIKRLCMESEKLEDFQQAYDLVERKAYVHPNNSEMRTINSLQNKYRADITVLGKIYEDYYVSIAEREMPVFGNKRFKDFYKSLLSELDEMALKRGIYIG